MGSFEIHWAKWSARGCLNIKTLSNQYRNSHYKDKAVSQPFYLYPIPQKSLCLNGALLPYISPQGQFLWVTFTRTDQKLPQWMDVGRVKQIWIPWEIICMTIAIYIDSGWSMTGCGFFYNISHCSTLHWRHIRIMASQITSSTTVCSTPLA